MKQTDTGKNSNDSTM